MSTRITKAIKTKSSNKVINFMGGTSYKINPIDTLKMITASSIFGEPSYYRGTDLVLSVDRVFAPYDLFEGTLAGFTTTEVMESAINNALLFDFKATLDWAVELREFYNMRLNPQVILVLAAMHENRCYFTSKNPGLFNEYASKIIKRADEPAVGLAYYIYKNGGINKLPNILKKAWAKKLEGLDRYQIAKYKEAGVGMIDTIRVCHASSPLIDELMQTGKVMVSENEKTWENLRSEGKSFTEIVSTIKLNHMALLRNLRNIFSENISLEMANDVLNQLKSGVLKGKQFPFRYYSAYKMIDKSNINHMPLVLDALQECIDIACDNMPKLSGKTICLSDNSGSAWGALNSEYGSVHVAEIGNLSSIITAKNSTEGYVGVFGDTLEIVPVSKRDGILTQCRNLSYKGNRVGYGTENGIWIFFRDAIENKTHYDNIFIYSDMQAGHGGLYGLRPGEYKDYSIGRYIDVLKLLEKYRKEVNPHVNVFSIQTAGYDNVLIPEYTYRANIMYGWTGKELLFADTMIKLWDSIENKMNS